MPKLQHALPLRVTLGLEGSIPLLLPSSLHTIPSDVALSIHRSIGSCANQLGLGWGDWGKRRRQLGRETSTTLATCSDDLSVLANGAGDGTTLLSTTPADRHLVLEE